MIDISVQKIKKAFEEGNDILDELSFEIYQGERVGLLGKNGAGKTTLFRLITGQLSSDEGEIVVPAHKNVGLISQIPVYPDHFTAEDVLRTAFERVYKIQREIKLVEDQMQHSSSNELLSKYDTLAFEYERLGGYNTDFELNRVVNGLRIPHNQRQQLFSSLSGGEKTRINLARLIMEKTDILLLDEPTNHLDLRATEWLEEFLHKYRGTVLVVSHDRYFLDNTITRAIEIVRGKAEFYSGNYSYYVAEKRRRYEQLLERHQREQVKAKRLKDAAAKLYAWGTGNQRLMKKSQAILKRAERVVQTERPSKDKSIKAQFSKHEFRGDEALVIRGLTKSYGERVLFDISELDVLGGERIALIGDNGTGKTTLIKLIMGLEEPDTGFVKQGPSVKSAYLPQIINFEYPRRSMLDTLISDLNLSHQMARNRLGAFMFSGEDVYKHVADLSGGEKSRLRLCMLMNSDINLLILDEPTNHLDLQSREWIESAIEQYGEALIFVSHDRYFINKFATRVWAITDGELIDFPGSFEEYREYISSKTTATSLTDSIDKAKKDISGASAADKRKGAAESNAPGETKLTKAKRKPSDIQKELRRLERDIEKNETALYDIKLQREEFASDFEKLLELDDLENSTQEELDILLALWEELAQEQA